MSQVEPRVTIGMQRILIVDDDPFQLDIVTELLIQLGASEVTPMSSGREALDALARVHPTVVLCDLDMAGMDGIELLRHLAERKYAGAIVLMSGASPDVLSTAGDLALLHGLRLLATLPKPVDPGELGVILATLEPTRDPATHAAASSHDEDPPAATLTAADLRAGIDSGRIEVYLQPKVTVVGRRVVGAEALLRWTDDDGNVLAPMTVVAVAEECGLVNELTMAIFVQALGHLARWQRQGADLRISVNLSNANLSTLDLPDSMAAAASTAGVDPARITLEITQAGLLDDLSAGMEVVGRLRLKGFGIAIDDYGMGYSTLAQLKNLPVTELKVDRSFVDGADRDETLSEILGSSAKLGHSLGMSVVAQGVESIEVLHLLESLGCDEVQGYLVARPMPATDFLTWKARWDATWTGEGSAHDESS
jgi:EAL domain-containing protein (putative c-di-GMP-specific phosphodiesterase class I)/ActR/RegA family two-component response regulator